MKKTFCILHWVAGTRYYVKKTYCNRLVVSENMIDAKFFDQLSAEKYFQKLINKFPDECLMITTR